MDELDLARDLADTAHEIALRHFYFRRGHVESKTKDDGTIVTVADQEIEEMIRIRIHSDFPNHAVLGEEGGLEGDPKAPTWIIDPIDGTNNYAAGIPIFATLIALRIDGRNEIGLVSAPAIQERYEATRGQGATLNGEPISVSGVDRLGEATVCSGGVRWFEKEGLGDAWRKVLSESKRDRGFGDFWGHVLVARGAADVMAEPWLHIWDVAALEVVVEEAGGQLTTFEGDPFPYPASRQLGQMASCLTTNGPLHSTLVKALGSDEA